MEFVTWGGGICLKACISVLVLRFVHSRIVPIEGLSHVSKSPQGDNVLSFLVLGDWGGVPYSPFYSSYQKAVASAMGVTASMIEAEFVLSLGDNFYEDGVKSVDDPRFKDTFEDVYTAPSLQVPWYTILGNHDYHSNVRAQLEYTQKSKRWNFPDFNYTLTFPIVKDSEKTVQILMLDTILLCGVSGSIHPDDPPFGPENPEKAEENWIWIEEKLRSSRSDFLIVAGHYPILSIGKHGPTDCLMERLKPLLYKYRVNAYLSGHDHNLQHLRHTEHEWNVDYFVIGSAARMDNQRLHINNVPEASSKFFSAEERSMGGFGYVQLNEYLMNLTLFNGLNQDVYHVTMTNRQTTEAGESNANTSGNEVPNIVNNEKGVKNDASTTVKGVRKDKSVAQNIKSDTTTSSDFLTKSAEIYAKSSIISAKSIINNLKSTKNNEKSTGYSHQSTLLDAASTISSFTSSTVSDLKSTLIKATSTVNDIKTTKAQMSNVEDRLKTMMHDRKTTKPASEGKAEIDGNDNTEPKHGFKIPEEWPIM
ncbi:unnamed protein product [Owenia fusiformis]|uniref:Tartrate-resistant acid phosphatase type 5 n=1 Tax=Owenia fusiformis TaxID=6347 RepID=A0A8J1YBP8_OWEFU|nr:unnamed protein product [Owenia fusiformis]